MANQQAWATGTNIAADNIARQRELKDEQRKATLKTLLEDATTPQDKVAAIQAVYHQDPSVLKQHVENLTRRVTGKPTQPVVSPQAAQAARVAPIAARGQTPAQQDLGAYQSQLDMQQQSQIKGAQRGIDTYKQLNPNATPEDLQRFSSSVLGAPMTKATTDEQKRGDYQALLYSGQVPKDASGNPLSYEGWVAYAASQGRGAAAPPKPPAHITVMKGGKPHLMGFDQQTRGYTTDLGIAPPTYAQIAPSMMARSVTTFTGKDGLTHRYQFNPKTMAYDKDLGLDLTGTAAHQVFQSLAVEDQARQVIADIDANRDLMGNLDSYVKQGLANTPMADPRADQMIAELQSLAATQPALHAFRSTSAMQTFEKIIGGLARDPDATIATINGLMKTPQAFTDVATGNNKGPAPKAGAGTASGAKKKWSKSKWAKANPGKDADAAAKQAAAQNMEVVQ